MKSDRRRLDGPLRLLAGLHWVIVALMVVACGGGGGAGDGGAGPNIPTPAPASALAVSGGVTRLGADGGTYPAAAGRAVRLVDIGGQGAVGAVLARTTTDASGRYTLTLPPGRNFGISLAVVADNDAGGEWRSLALNSDTEVGPTAEAVTRELFAAFATAPGGPSTTARLGDFIRNATLGLSLMVSARSEPEAAVAWWRQQLRSDASASAALDQLKATGRINESLGDLFSLFGFAGGAVEAIDSDDGPRITLTRVTGLAPVELSQHDLSPNQQPDAAPTRQVRWQDDGVWQLFLNAADPSSQVLLGIIGPHQVASFHLVPGVEQVLTQFSGMTNGYDFGGDRLPDRLLYQVRQRVVGVEAVQVLGQERRALRVDTVNDLTLQLSESGTLGVVGTTKQWLVPGLGIVRTEFIGTSKDVAGALVTVSSSTVLSRAVINGTSWPGNLTLEATEAPIPAGYSDPRTLGLTSNGQLLIRGGVFRECCTANLGLSLRPSTEQSATSADVELPGGLIGGRPFLSPDGRRLYVAISKTVPGNGVENLALDLDQANDLGATIVRYDALTLREELRFNLPPIPSTLEPGRAFPRYLVRTILVSPHDSTQFVAAGVDAVLVRGSTAAVAALSAYGLEAVGTGGRARVFSDQVRLLGWDAERNELRVELNGGGPLSRVAPVSDQGLQQSQLRDSVGVLSFRYQGRSDGLYDKMSTGRIYVGGFRVVFDAQTGAPLGSLENHSDEALRGAGCALRGADVLCLTSNDLYVLDASNLTLRRKLSLHDDLRRLTGVLLSTSPVGLYPEQDGSLVYLGPDDRFSAQSAALAYRLTFE